VQILHPGVIGKGIA
jgi:hypothetical protein